MPCCVRHVQNSKDLAIRSPRFLKNSRRSALPHNSASSRPRGLPAPPSTPVQRSLRSCSALSMLPAATIWGCSNLLLQCLRNWRGMEATVSVPMPRRLIAHSQSMSFFKEPLMMSMLSVASLTLWGRVIPGPGMPTSSDWASGASTSILPRLYLFIPNVVGRFASTSLMRVPMKQLESIPLLMA